jgi:hypothetical protein
MLKSRSRVRKIVVWGIPIALTVCVLVIVLFSLSIELGVKNVCAAATRKYPGDKIEAVMMSVESDRSAYSAHVYKANNYAFWALGQLGDQRALPFLKDLLTGEACDHETNLCQGEIQEAIQKLEGNEFNLPKFLWRRALNN